MAFKSKKDRFIKVSAFFILLLMVIMAFTPGVRKRLFVVFSHECTTRKQAVFSNKLNDRVVNYTSAGKISGIEICRNESEILERFSEGKLVHVRAGRGYHIEKLTHSYPYLTPDAKKLLDEIGKRFRAKTNEAGFLGSEFIITSMTRTREKLNDLMKMNTNASGNSPHLYGNAFDISYVSFRSRKFVLTACDKRYFKEILAEIIVELRKERKCWATYESQQTCFHLVSR